MTTLHEAAQQALEALEEIHHGNMTPMAEGKWNKAIEALRSALAQQPAAKYIGECSDGSLVQLYEDLKKGTELYTATPALAQQGEQPCKVCEDVHAILDADESMIIRDAKDGYPEGRTPRVLTLQERVTALCVYAADWKRWYEETQAAPAAHPPTEPESFEQWNAKQHGDPEEIGFLQALRIAYLSGQDSVTRAHGIGAAPAAHPDARKVIEELLYCVEAWKRGCLHEDYWRDRDDAIQAGQEWLEENK